MDQLSEYYSRRVAEQIYQRDYPIRQDEQRGIVEAISDPFRGKSVVELSCGTGYWTVPLSESARSIAWYVSYELLPLFLSLISLKTC